MRSSTEYHVLGLMSGSSLDGIDIAYCIIHTHPVYSFTIVAAETIPFDKNIAALLKNITPDIHYHYQQEEKIFTEFAANAIQYFLRAHQLPLPDFIASHGHTVYHFPALGKTKQIGDGLLLANLVGCNVIYDFRMADVAEGGQGAPLVPFCDQVFFSNYHACLNIGGIANISMHADTGRIGFDICGANQLLNFIASTIGLEYDENGELAEAGLADPTLLAELNACAYFQLPYPKSLDNHFVRKYFIERIAASPILVNDKLATATYHIAEQIAAVIQQHKSGISEPYRLLVTGGGAFNTFLIRSIERLASIRIMLPDLSIIQYKEALAMCLMGVERWLDKPNFLPSVTGAKKAVSGGIIVMPTHK